jgi:tetratricopeptide (TPR) repeat protein
MIRKQVVALGGLPGEAKSAIESLPSLKEKSKKDWRAQRVSVVQSLVKAGSPQVDAGEPSWSVLGRLLEEEFFVQAFEGAWFIRQTLCADSEEHVDMMLPLVPEHPYANFLKLCGIAEGEERNQVVKLLGKLQVPEPDVQMEPMFYYVRKAESELKKSPRFDIYARYQSCEDDISRDLAYDCTSSNPSLVLDRARRLLEISPYHPIAAGSIVRNDWKAAQPHLSEWEARFGGHWAYVREIAKHYQDDGPPELAEKHIQKFVELAPEVTNYRALATLYRKRGDTQKYLQALEDALKLPEMGLDHARVRVQLAEYYMEKGEFQTALPYAKKAAESYAADCLLCLAECYEGMGNMKLAEKWIRACAERYRTSGDDWFFWCKRTGYGDVQAARELAIDCLAPRADRSSEDRERYAIFLLLSNEPRQALEAFRKDFVANYNPNSGLHAVLIAHKMNNRKLHDELLDAIVEKSDQDKNKADRRKPKIELARLLQNQGQRGGGLDHQQVEQIVNTAPEGEMINILYFAGRFLELHGDQSQANAYLLRAARSTAPSRHTKILACDRCRQLGLRIETQPAVPKPASASE